MQQGFSRFGWLLGLLCLPSALWPLGLFVSAAFSNNPNLTASQINWFSVAFWIYPFVLLAISGLLYKLQQHQPKLAFGLLFGCFIVFYTLAFYIFRCL